MFLAIGILLSTTGVGAIAAFSLFGIGAALFITGTFLASAKKILSITRILDAASILFGIISLLQKIVVISELATNSLGIFFILYTISQFI